MDDIQRCIDAVDEGRWRFSDFTLDLVILMYFSIKWIVSSLLAYHGSIGLIIGLSRIRFSMHPFSYPFVLSDFVLRKFWKLCIKPYSDIIPS